MKRPVVISSLAMRFYKSHGWTIDELSKYLKKGSFDTKSSFDNDEYYILEVGAELDIDRMYEDDLIGDLYGKDNYGEIKNKTDREALMDRNW
jgi:hypothetical protein